jgi:hypothetical protein
MALGEWRSADGAQRMALSYRSLQVKAGAY